MLKRRLHGCKIRSKNRDLFFASEPLPSISMVKDQIPGCNVFLPDFLSLCPDKDLVRGSKSKQSALVVLKRNVVSINLISSTSLFSCVEISKTEL